MSYPLKATAVAATRQLSGEALDILLTHPAIDWDAVRGAPPFSELRDLEPDAAAVLGMVICGDGCLTARAAT
jgi:hypothetical protein